MILNFGNIYYNGIYKFKKCPKKIDENKKYTITGEFNNTLIKNGETGYFIGVPCENILESLKEYKWKIKIIRSKNNENNYNDNYNYNNNYNYNYNYNYKNNYIKVGVAPIDFDINSSTYNYGWYLDCSNSCLYSGPPHNYSGKKTNLNHVKDEVIISLDMKNQSLKFIIDDKDNGESYSNIPIDKPLTPVVFLYNKNEKIEITNCLN